jgi:cathepsin L
MLHLQNRYSEGPNYHVSTGGNIPNYVDWRTQGIVNQIQDQGSCGSCYAYSALAAIEGQYFKKTGQLIKLSEQNIVDCSRSYGNDGCAGGIMNSVFKFVKDNGVATDYSYPYEERVRKFKV